MARDLNTFVYVTDDHLEPHGFGPGDEVPEWAAAKIGDHCYIKDAEDVAGEDEGAEDVPEPEGDEAPKRRRPASKNTN